MFIRPQYFAVATIAGVLFFLLGQALLPSLPNDIDAAFGGMVEHRDRLMAARLFSSAGAFLLVPAAVGIGCLFRPAARGSRTVLVGALLFGVATFSNAVSQAVEGYAGWGATASDIDPTSGKSILEGLGTGLIGFPIGFWSIPVFALGGLILAVGILRAQWVPAWIPVVLFVGLLLGAAFGGRGYIVALTQAPFTVAMIALATYVGKGEAPRTGDSSELVEAC